MNDHEKEEESVQYFVVEGIMTRMDMAMQKLKDSNADSLEKMSGAVTEMGHNNKRMLAALRVVCIALVLACAIFVAGYTINNNNWLRYVERLQQTEDAGHVQNDVPEVYQLTDQGDHQGENP